jgi:hypothetical protein
MLRGVSRAFVVIAPLLALGCGAAETTVVGLTTRGEIEERLDAWREAAASASPWEEVARELASVPPGAEIDVYLGTWCGDSRREVPRLFRALELVPEPWPFTIRWIGVDRAKRAPGLTEDAALRYVPTFVVRRDGVEVGRVVESAPRGIERELVDLLRGTTRGVISGRTDLSDP